MTNTALTELANLSSRVAAEPLVQYLRSQGLDARVVADDAGGLDPALAFVQGVSIQVPEGELVRGRLLLEAWRQGTLAVGWEDEAATIRIEPSGG